MLEFIRSLEVDYTQPLEVVEVVLHFLVLADLLWSHIKVHLFIITPHVVLAIFGPGPNFFQISSDIVLIEYAEGLFKLFNVNT